MNIIVICLSIIVVFLLFILVNYFTNNSTKLASQTSLLASNVIIPVTTNPDAKRFALGMWVYVNSWNMNREKILYEFPGKIKLYLDATTPTLSASIPTTVGSPTIITITQNFPLQKWCYVTISVDNSFVDTYIDGKLVKSIKLNGLQSPYTESTIYLGGKNPSLNDILISNFYRWTNPLAPHDVWNQYMKGNGGNMISKMFNSYGLDVNLKKDSAVAATFHIF